MITNTISYVEFFTFLLAATMLVLVSYSCHLAVGDNNRLRKRPAFVKNGPLHTHSKGRIRTEIRKVLTGTIWCLTLLLFMTEDGGGNYLQRTTLALVFAILFTLGFMAIDTLLYLIERNKIEDYLEKNPLPGPVAPSKVVVDSNGVTGTLIVPVEVEQE